MRTFILYCGALSTIVILIWHMMTRPRTIMSVMKVFEDNPK